MRAKVISIANRKGGVGKTTLTLSLAEGLAALKKKRVLVVDLDSQINISMLITGGLAPTDVPWKRGKTIVDLLDQRATDPQTRPSFFISRDVIDHEPGKAVSLLSGDHRLLGIERRLLSRPATSFQHVNSLFCDVVEDIIEEQAKNFDVIMFDCPPGFSLITDIALKRSDLILLPTAPTMLASQGIQAYVKYLQDDLQMADAPTKTHVFLTMTGRTNTSMTFEKLIRAELKKPYPAYHVFDSSYAYCDGFQKATDRRDQTMQRMNAVWQRLDRLRGRALFHRLYGGVWTAVDKAATELTKTLNMKGADNDGSSAREGNRTAVQLEARA